MTACESLLAKLDAYPRIPLAEYPTPLAFLPHLSRQVGRAVYLKRDDAIGPGLGGNKTRKLEYLLADAQRRGAKKIATFGGLQSNHARLTAAAARLCGLEAHLFYFSPRPEQLAGNLLLNELLGAHLHFVPVGEGGGMSLEAAIRLAHTAALARIGPHYFIPVGGHSWLGCLGYVRAALEIDEQARALNIAGARLVMAAGSGGTLAGLLAGLSLTGSRLRPLGIDVGKLWRGFPDSIARLASEVCTRLGTGNSQLEAGSSKLEAGKTTGVPGAGDSGRRSAWWGVRRGQHADGRGGRPVVRFTPGQVPLIEGAYVGEGYGIPSQAGQAAVRHMAKAEGIFLDPVYTGKAFAGLLDLIARGAIGKDEPVIFLHTGGVPALFA